MCTNFAFILPECDARYLSSGQHLCMAGVGEPAHLAVAIFRYPKPRLSVLVCFLCPGLTRIFVSPFFVALQISNVRAKLSRDRLSSVEASIGSFQVC